jgi:hypothetical protein
MSKLLAIVPVDNNDAAIGIGARAQSRGAVDDRAELIAPR